jgi:hypothetical protein
MKKNKTSLFVALFLMLRIASAGEIFDDISNAIHNGDAHQLATFFGNSVDLTIVDQENVYSKAQAELVLKDFFEKNHPKTFSIIHKGSSPEKTQYAIGKLTTVNGKNFRVSFYIKSTDGRNQLQELRFEIE